MFITVVTAMGPTAADQDEVTGEEEEEEKEEEGTIS